MKRSMKRIGNWYYLAYDAMDSSYTLISETDRKRLGLPEMPDGGTVEIDIPEIRVVEPPGETDWLIETADFCLDLHRRGIHCHPWHPSEMAKMATAVKVAIKRQAGWKVADQWNRELIIERDKLRAELAEARARIAELEAERDMAQTGLAGERAELDQLRKLKIEAVKPAPCPTCETLATQIREMFGSNTRSAGEHLVALDTQRHCAQKARDALQTTCEQLKRNYYTARDRCETLREMVRVRNKHLEIHSHNSGRRLYEERIP